jgi:hypothetical protein
MSVGPKYGVLGGFDECNESHTFLVLGPIDLTNGRAGMTDSLLFTLRGTSQKHKNRCINKININI